MTGADPCSFGASLAALALGALDDAERARVIEHLDSGCGSCQAELRALRRDLEGLAEAVPARAPPRSTREWVLDQVRRSAAAAKGRPD